MEIAKYFASLSVKIQNSDIKSVDAFLNNIGKGLKTNTKSTDTLEKAVKKETKTTVDGLVQKEQKQKALNKQITVAAKNQKAWNKEFAYSLKMMTSKPLSKSALKAQQGVYDQLFGAVAPKAMMGATGANQRAWNTRFKQQIAGMAAGGSDISRRARQEQLNAAFGAVGSNPRLANMAAYSRNEQKVIRRNAESINKLFPAMGRSPLPARSRDRTDAVSIYRGMFKAADVRIKDLNRLANKVREEGNLLGRIGRNSPHFANLPNMGKMREVSALGRIGKNARAFSSYGRVGNYQSSKAQRVSGEVSALGRIGRNASTYGVPSRGSLQERLAAFRSNRVEGVQVQNQVEASERRILDLKRREDSRRLTHQQTVERMALRHEQKLAEIREKNAVKLSRVAKPRVSNGGGYNPTHNIAHASGQVFSDRFSLGYGVLPPQLLAALAPVAGAVAVQQGSVALGNSQALRERQRTQLDIASGESSRYGKDFSNKRFFELSNQLGVEAEPMIDPYAKFMKQMLTQGRTTDEAFGIYKDMSIATRSAGLGQVSMERQAYALQQIFGLGYAQGDELYKQLVDSNPTMLGYIEKEYAKQTGKDESTMKDAVSNREISSQLIIDAYKTAAAAGQGRVAEFSSTVQADQARFTNAQLEEQMSRTLSDEVIPSMREYVKAQKEMYEAMKPFRDALYDAAAEVLSFSASVLKTSAPYVNEAGTTMNVAKGIAPNSFTLLKLLMPFGAMPLPDALSIKGPESIPSQSGIDFLRRSKESFMGGGQTQVMVQPGAFVINTQATDAEEVGKFTVHYFQTELQKTLQANPQKE